jgi:hypothetical protein
MWRALADDFRATPNAPELADRRRSGSAVDSVPGPSLTDAVEKVRGQRPQCSNRIMKPVFRIEVAYEVVVFNQYCSETSSKSFFNSIAPNRNLRRSNDQDLCPRSRQQPEKSRIQKQDN